MNYLFGTLFVLCAVKVVVMQVQITQLKATLSNNMRHLEAVRRTLGIANNAYVCYDKANKKKLEVLLGKR